MLFQMQHHADLVRAYGLGGERPEREEWINSREWESMAFAGVWAGMISELVDLHHYPCL
jgi:hypothetical protein